MSNRLKYETSPYLLQHKDNPVHWYPWGEEAFAAAKAQDKPVFLSIGYSSCHWCHVQARESFEDEEIAELLNRYFISIKVDREERPDIDSVYMEVCQAFTGNGGWPLSIFMTADQKPFFAGTYFPKRQRGGWIGMRELLLTIGERWQTDRKTLLRQSEELIAHLSEPPRTAPSDSEEDLLSQAVAQFRRSYDEENGGFGSAPKFPTPHNLLFLLSRYQRTRDASCLQMAEHTLVQMYCGGLFDHIGFGFCRYSTDEKFLVPHFEKMLYDNALLILAYAKAYAITKKPLYLNVAEKTAEYILREMTSPEGGFYSAQDADSEGEEGKYYLFTPDEISAVLGKEQGAVFNRHFDLTSSGNFEGKNIPNLLKSAPTAEFDSCLPPLRDYRKKRHSLLLDDKILTAWNGFMIAALCQLFLASGNETYLTAAKEADAFIRNHLYEKGTLFVSFREGRRGVKGFLDDYAAYAFAQTELYRVTLNRAYLEEAVRLCHRVTEEFSDPAGGFFLYGKDSETLIVRPKEIYDGAIPSGNSLMAYNFVRLQWLTEDSEWQRAAETQFRFFGGEVSRFARGYAMYLTALSEYMDPPAKITVVAEEGTDLSRLARSLPSDSAVVFQLPSPRFPLKNGKTTYYVCRGGTCFPPVNRWEEVLSPEKTKNPSLRKGAV